MIKRAVFLWGGGLLQPHAARDPGRGQKIDVLMNNAGVMAIPQRQETKDEMSWWQAGLLRDGKQHPNPNLSHA